MLEAGIWRLQLREECAWEACSLQRARTMLKTLEVLGMDPGGPCSDRSASFGEIT